MTWTLLGDLAAREGRFKEARRLYGRASQLNPLDAGLQELRQNPESGLR